MQAEDGGSPPDGVYVTFEEVGEEVFCLAGYAECLPLPYGIRASVELKETASARRTDLRPPSKHWHT